MPGRMRDPGPRVRTAQVFARPRGDEDTPARPRGDEDTPARPGSGRDATTGGSPAVASDTATRPDDYASLTVAELRALAAEAGIEGRSTMRRSELVSALRRR